MHLNTSLLALIFRGKILFGFVSSTSFSFSERKFKIILALFTDETKIDGIVNNKVHNCH